MGKIQGRVIRTRPQSQVKTAVSRISAELLLIILTILFMSLVSLYAHAEGATNYTEILKTKILTTENCLKNQKNFQGCLDVLHFLNPEEIKAERSVPKSDDLTNISLFLEIHKLDLQLTEKARAERFREFEKDPDAISILIATIDFHQLTQQISLLAFEVYIKGSIDPRARLHVELDIADKKPEEKPKDKNDVAVTENNAHSGAMMRVLNDQIMIEGTVPGSPAENAGLKPMDLILKINGKNISDIKEGQLGQELWGAVNSPLSFDVLRGHKKLNFSMKRQLIDSNSLYSKYLESNGTKTLYVRMLFDDDATCNQLNTILQKAETDGAKSVIFDLRGNTGGYVRNAICIASLFLPAKSTLSSIHDYYAYEHAWSTDEGAVKELKTYSEFSMDLWNYKRSKLPLVVLIDVFSKSSSESLSAAFQDHKRAWLIGDRTGGKGSVQGNSFFDWETLTVVPVVQKTTLYLTAAFYKRPSGFFVNEIGVEPDLNIPTLAGVTDSQLDVLRETYKTTPRPPGINPGANADTRTKEAEACLDAENLKNLKISGGQDAQLEAALLLLNSSCAI